MRSSRHPIWLAGALALACAACAPSAPPVTQDGAAAAPVADAAAVGEATGQVHRFRIGALDAAVLRDGEFVLPNDGSILAIGQHKADVDALLRGAGVETDPLRLSIQGLLVRSAAHVILFDTGYGTHDPAYGGTLMAALDEAGVDPAQVTDVFISHAHADHVGGLLDRDGQPVFTAARIRMSAPEWAALQADAERAPLVQAIASRVEVFAPGATQIVPGVSAVAVDGHTPGHSAYLVEDGDARLLFLGDTAHHHVISVQRPRWTIQFDGDAPTAEASREALLARLADEALDVSSPHFPFPGLGRVERRDDRFVWVPAP